MSEYHARGNPAKVIQHLTDNPDAAPMMSAQIGELLGIAPDSVGATLARAVKNEALFTYREGGLRYYTLAAPEEEEEEPEPFLAGMWTDGDVVLRGVQVNEDGSVTLKPAQLQQLLNLVSGFGAVMHGVQVATP